MIVKVLGEFIFLVFMMWLLHAVTSWPAMGAGLLVFIAYLEGMFLGFVFRRYKNESSKSV